MLKLTKQRRVNKAERKRLEWFGFVEMGGKEKKSKIGGLGVARTLVRLSTGCDGLMDIEYKRRGSVREWDLGKDSPMRGEPVVGTRVFELYTVYDRVSTKCCSET
jgi:hypothetical protein